MVIPQLFPDNPQAALSFSYSHKGKVDPVGPALVSGGEELCLSCACTLPLHLRVHG